LPVNTDKIESRAVLRKEAQESSAMDENIGNMEILGVNLEFCRNN